MRLFHEKDYSNLIEGELDKNGAGVLLRKKMDKFSDLFIWRKKKEEVPPTRRREQAPESGAQEDNHEREITDRNVTQQ